MAPKSGASRSKAAKAMAAKAMVARAMAAKTLAKTTAAKTNATNTIAEKETASTSAETLFKITSEEIIDSSFKDECTVENSMYPFKLVLSPAEERPLQIGKSPPQTLSQVEVWIATCPPKSSASIIRFIHQYLIPLDINAKIDIKHLRRLRRVPEYPNGPCHLEIVLCGSSSISRQELASLIWIHSDEIPQIRPRLALASKWPAFTPDQYTSFSKLWPVSMRSTPGRFVKDPSIETTEMKRFMTGAIRLSQRVYLIQDKPPYNLPIATLIVDPSTSKVLASTYDTRVSTGHPLEHSVMTAINLLAMTPRQRNSREKYYASGYDFYTTHEPCVMCCMAMVHSRARRCVFWREMRYTGGKGLGWKKELNHKYMCFQWVGDQSVEQGVLNEIPWDVCA